MSNTGHRRWRLRVVVAGLLVAGALLHQDIIAGLAYAVEKGKVQANADELAKVEALSNTFRSVAKVVRPGVVRIVSKKEAARPKMPAMEDLPEPFRKFFERQSRPEAPQPEQGTGSGVIINAEKGYVLTNNHVVGGAKRIDVYLADGRKEEGKLLGADDKTDLALVQINAERLHAVKLGDSDQMEVGDWVLAIGAPFGLEQTVSQGIISAKGRSNVGIVQYEDFIQTDAAINPGNSGGPLVNMRGEVIGINTAIATNPLVAGYMGVGFAIPTKMINNILPSLIEGKKVVRGYLGVSIQSLKNDAGLAENLGLKTPLGAFVGDVMPKSPAAKAGLKVDDVILKYDGKTVSDNTDLTSMVASTKPGTKVKVVIWRDREEKELEVEIGQQPKGFSPRGWLQPGGAEESGGQGAEVDSLGMSVSDVTPELAKRFGLDEDAKGIVVTEVDPYGEAYSASIRPGDLILAVNGKAVDSPSDFDKAVTDEALKEGVRIRVKEKQGTRTVFIKMTDPEQKKGESKSKGKNKDE